MPRRRSAWAVALTAAFPTLFSWSACAVTCERRIVDAVPYAVCTVDIARERLELFDGDANGRPFATFERLAAEVAAEHHRLLFAVNAGIYRLDLRPVGLSVAAGVTRSPAETGDGAGNFFLKPNGVFFVAEHRAGVMDTAAYLAAKLRPALATQSGPLLVIGGRLHPAFQPDGDSRKIRNGVGVRDHHIAVFALAEQPVSFGRFARLFRDALGCPDALYLDGTVSALYDPAHGRNGQVWPLGPILGVIGPALPDAGAP